MHRLIVSVTHSHFGPKLFLSADPEAPDDPGAYAMPHTALTYAMGPDGEYLGHFSDAVSVDEVARRLRAMLG